MPPSNKSAHVEVRDCPELTNGNQVPWPPESLLHWNPVVGGLLLTWVWGTKKKMVPCIYENVWTIMGTGGPIMEWFDSLQVISSHFEISRYIYNYSTSKGLLWKNIHSSNIYIYIQI